MTFRKKLIEVALPLDVINEASAYDKMPGIGPHPKGLHHWWARLPLPCARAFLFASLVDDPSSNPNFKDKSDAEQNVERERLFEIIKMLLQKKIHTNKNIFQIANREITNFTDGQAITLLDPFSGGGSIPLEGQRLGLNVQASDLNPISVIINKAQIEILPRFKNSPPVNPITRKNSMLKTWPRSKGLAEDVRYYGDFIREQAINRLKEVFPQIILSASQTQEKGTVIAWLWARTVKCPNPACGVQAPLVKSFSLSTKKGRKSWVEPKIDRTISPPDISFSVKTGQGKPLKGTIDRRGAICLNCNTPITFNYIRGQGQNGKIKTKLMAIAMQGKKNKIYISPNKEHEAVNKLKSPESVLDSELPDKALGFRVQKYGLTKHRDLFTPRQLLTLKTLSDLVLEVRETVKNDALHSKFFDDSDTRPLFEGGKGPDAYADAITVFLSFGVDRCADFNNALCRWSQSNEKIMNLFARGAIPMVWDFAEANTLTDSVGGWKTCIEYISKCIDVVQVGNADNGIAYQSDAASLTKKNFTNLIVSTDPPYYGNIGYSDLSDFFYVWLKRSLSRIYPDLFETLLVPKAAELIAAPERFGDDAIKAKAHFEDGFREVFTALKEKLDPRFPLTVYYAFKQEDSEVDSKTSDDVTLTTGWETMLNGLVHSGFQITATWPVHASQKWRMRAMDSNALASYIILACRPRPKAASMATRRDFLSALKRELPMALRQLQLSNIAPVDMAQASIGPGMTIYSRYHQVLESDGTVLSIRTALALINQALDEYLSEQEGAYDSDTRWALAWFEQYAFNEGPYGDAETLSTAKNTSVNGMVQAGFLQAGGGKVRLLRRNELAPDWDPHTDKRVTVWEICQHLIRTLQDKGEAASAQLLADVGPLGDAARDLAYRLYQICERKGWAQEALPYNALVASWSDIGKLSREVEAQPIQTGFKF